MAQGYVDSIVLRVAELEEYPLNGRESRRAGQWQAGRLVPRTLSTTGLFWKMRQSVDREAYEKLSFLRKAPCCTDRADWRGEPGGVGKRLLP
jgi:hypothetical protein